MLTSSFAKSARSLTPTVASDDTPISSLPHHRLAEAVLDAGDDAAHNAGLRPNCLMREARR
jgi:hypothetical protein